MTGLDRRQVLRSVGAGAGAGVSGLGAAGATRPDSDTQQEVEATFTATVGSGFLVINGNSKNDANASVSISLENIDGEIVLDGEIYDDGTWQSDDITFPNVNPADIIDPGEIDLVDDIEFDDQTEITVVVDSISGVYDPDAEGGALVTGSIDMAIDAFATGTAFAFGGDIEVQFSYDFSIDVNEGEDITLTTEESQELVGTAETLGCADPVVRVVNNNFTVPEAQGKTEECIEDVICINVNDQLELPSDVSTRNFIELDLDITWDGDQPFSPSPVVGDSSPRDLNCDGTYDDIDGDRELTIMDVQTLFDRRNDEELESNAELYDFSNTGGDRISIFDVQALFNMLENREE
jgi:hypothetical protein